MRGFPKVLATKQDYLFAKENFPKAQWLPAFQSLLDERIKWITTAKLEDGDKGITDVTHRIVEIKDDRTGVVQQRYQEEFTEDVNCKLLRIGFSVDEIEKLIGEEESVGVAENRSIITEKVAMADVQRAVVEGKSIKEISKVESAKEQ